MVLRFTAKALLFALLPYCTLWTTLHGDSNSQDDFEVSGDNNTCVPCPAGYQSTQDCNCTTCNCSLLDSTSSYAFLLHMFFDSCNCSGFCESVSDCEQCELGHNSSTKGQGECKECPKGTYADEYGVKFCTPCKAGRYCDTTGATQCDLCPPGTFSSEGSATCTNCSAGSYSNNDGSTECTNCSNGEYIDFPGAVGCYRCENGTFTNSTVGFSKCHSCNEGHYCNTTGCTRCEPCPPGTASKYPDICYSCLIGTYSSDYGSTICLPCTIGTICNISGCTECQPCPYGYQPTNGISLFDCELCAAGTYRDSTTGNFCVRCQNGYYQLDPGKTSCKICPEGFYCPYPSSEPIHCPENAVCPEGSYEVSSCMKLYTYSDSKKRCIPIITFYLIITLCAIFAVLVLTLFCCMFYCQCRQRKKLSYEKLPMQNSIKKQPISEPVYSGY